MNLCMFHITPADNSSLDMGNHNRVWFQVWLRIHMDSVPYATFLWPLVKIYAPVGGVRRDVKYIVAIFLVCWVSFATAYCGFNPVPWERRLPALASCALQAAQRHHCRSCSLGIVNFSFSSARARRETTMPSAGVSKGEHRIIGMFSYGSNNEQQLRARVNNPNLRGYPAHLDDYIRIFGFDTPSEGNTWGGGSVASIAPKKGGRVFGRYYVMSPEEMETLDIYEHVMEGMYWKKAVMVQVYMQDAEDGGEGAPKSVVMSSAIAYVMSPGPASIFKQPSPAYLTAVHYTLSQSFPNLRGVPVEVCDCTCTKRSEWVHPGHLNLPLKAFLAEVGLMEQPPWKLPTVLNPIVSRLNAAGIFTAEELYKAAVDLSLLSRLEKAASEPHATKSDEDNKDKEDKYRVVPAESSTEKEGTIGLTASLKLLTSMSPIPAITQETVDIIARLGGVSN